ncbi:MAG: DoxX family protein [Pyrinomonadaceae bacterium]
MRIAYWTVTALMAGFMLMTSLPDVLMVEGAMEMFRHLGYPSYFVPFVGVAKILGVITVLVPGFRRLKEWAYAGLVFDLIGAFYSHLSLGDQVKFWILPLIGLVLVGGSYFLYHAVYDNPRSFRRIEGT